MSERYEIRGRISQGGVGVVYRAWDTRLEREVAVKRLLPPEDEHQAASAEQSLTREASALSALQHPNIIQIYSIEQDEEGPFLILELIDGINIEEFVEKSTDQPPASQDEFIDLAEQILDALSAGQALGLNHRDIKPENIMLRRLHGGRLLVKILDYGLAKFSAQPSLQTIDQTGSILGSIYFMAPEQFERLPLDVTADMYSVGCVFYYLLTRTYPFNGDTMAAVMESHLHHKVNPLWEVRTDLDPSLCAWVMKLMERTREDRYPDADSALSALRNWRAAGGQMDTGTAANEVQPSLTSRLPRQPILSRSSQPISAKPITTRLVTGGDQRATGRHGATGSVPPRVATGRTANIGRSIRPGTGAVRTSSSRVRTTTGTIPGQPEGEQPTMDRSLVFKLLVVGATVIGFIGLLILVYFLFRAINPQENADVKHHAPGQTRISQVCGESDQSSIWRGLGAEARVMSGERAEKSRHQPCPLDPNPGRSQQKACEISGLAQSTHEPQPLHPDVHVNLCQRLFPSST